ncbi:MAG TPA: 3-oxoacyl-ACP reductase FabG [Acidimicrobiia bacterium]|nr:3-oxoacyl-ACP reductase FabG [Acidimicrobiia bacterium]
MDTERTLQGVPAVVTGASRGIGAAVASRLAGAGAPVAVVYKSDGDGAAAVVRAIEAAGGTALARRADVADPDEVEALFSTVEAAFGPVGLLVNNAGLHRGGRVQNLALEDWNAVVATGLTGTFLCCRRAVPPMIGRGGGRIVNLSSVVGINGFPGDSAYGAVKAGVIGLTKSLALELARDGISVNAVAPGFVDTDMTRALDPKVLDRVVGSIPQRRMATIDEIADTVTSLATGPGYVTGTTVVIDGGWTLA